MPDKMSIKEMIASRLKLAREMAGLSQNQVAKILDLKRPAISEIEAGRRKISAEELAQIAEVYDVDPSWLLGTDKSDHEDVSDKVKLAAREFSKLKPEDVDKLYSVLAALKK